MRELWRMRPPQYNAQNIESNCPIMPAFVHVTDGGLGQKFLFSSRHGIFGSLKQIVAAGFDFHENHRPTVHADNVQLCLSVSPISFQNLEANADEKIIRQIFALFARFVVFSHSFTNLCLYFPNVKV